MYLSNKDILILNLTKLNYIEYDLNNIKKLIKNNDNWDYFNEYSIINGVAPIIYKNIIKFSLDSKIPKKTLNLLSGAYHKTLSRNILLYENFKNIIKLFSSYNIEVITLKGMVLAESLYKDIGLRQISDIDLLLKYNDIEKAGNLLIELGYKNLNLKLKRDFHKNKHFIFLKNGVIIELHQHIYHYTEKFNIEIDNYWHQAKLYLINGVNTFVLSDIDMVQQLCIHLYIHLRKGKFSLISFYDIKLFIQSLDYIFNWNLLFKKCEYENCLKEISVILLITQKYFGSFLSEKELNKILKFSDENFEKRFIDIFHGTNLQLETAENKINKFRDNKGFANKIKYFLNEVFQIKEFMINRYNPKFPKLYFFYYPVRMLSFIYKYLKFKNRQTK